MDDISVENYNNAVDNGDIAVDNDDIDDNGGYFMKPLDRQRGTARLMGCRLSPPCPPVK